MPGVDVVVDLNDGDSLIFLNESLNSRRSEHLINSYLSPPPAVDLGAKADPGGLAGNPDHARDRERSRLLSEFTSRRSRISTSILQVGPAAAQLAETTMQITDLATGFKTCRIRQLRCALDRYQ